MVHGNDRQDISGGEGVGQIRKSYTNPNLAAVYVYVVLWSEFPVVSSYPHYPQEGRFVALGSGRLNLRLESST